MAFTSWRGTMGLIKPTHRPGSLEETIRLLPEGIGVVPMTVGIKRGDSQEFHDVLDAFGAKVDEMAELGVDLIAPAGAPPFMLLGHAGERKLLDAWEAKHKVPVVSAGVSQAEAMRALQANRVVGVTYFTGQMNDAFAQYFTDAGFEVLAMDGIDVPFDQVQKLSSREVYVHTKAAFRRHSNVDLVYMLGGGWRVLDIISVLEEDLGVPVLHSVPARVWNTQQHFMVGGRTQGFGRLLAQMPPRVEA